MSLPDRKGTFKGMPLEWGITKSAQQGLPQFAVKFFLTEYYDQNENQWFDVSDNQWTITAYSVLFFRKDGGVPQATLNHAQICKVFGWDGRGFGYLTKSDFSEKICQVRIDDNDYAEAKTKLIVTWIDVEDADPNPKLRTLNEKDVKDLELEFKDVMVINKQQAAKPVSAPTLPALPPKLNKVTSKEVSDIKPVERTEVPVEPEFSIKNKKAELVEKSKKLRAKNEHAAESEKKESPKKKITIDGVYTKRQAWLDSVEVKSIATENMTDEDFRALWDAAIANVAPDGDEDKLDADGWNKVKDVVIDDLNKTLEN